MTVRPSRKFRRKCKVYKLFAEEHDSSSFSDKTMEELYLFETYGKGDINIGGFNQSNNGYAVGKRWCDLQVASWLEDCEMHVCNTRVMLPRGKIGTLKESYSGWYNVISELYQDETFKDHWWWLDSIFKKFIRRKNAEEVIKKMKGL